MKVDFGRIMRTLDGEPLMDGAPGKSKHVTVGVAVVNALLMENPDEKVSGTEKVSRFNLARRIQNGEGDSVEVTAEEISTMKDLVGKLYAPIVVGQVWEHLEGKSPDEPAAIASGEASAPPLN